MTNLLSCCSLFPVDVIRTIRDPEKPNTLEELDVVNEKCVEVQDLGDEEYLIIIRFAPTVPHCSLATLIGKCLDKDVCCLIMSTAVQKTDLQCMKT